LSESGTKYRPPGDPFAVSFDRWIERWGLVPDGAPILTFASSLLPVRAGRTPAILKVAHESEERGGAALMVWWGGQGAAPVLAHEDDALLMERATGARSLERLTYEDDDAACRILCAATAALHAPRPTAPPPLIPLTDWFAPLLSGHARYGGLTTVCAETAAALLATPHDQSVLHGDIHHGNVLDFGEERGWLAIDPKRLAGERAFDYANLFRNGDIETAERAGARFARRLDIVSETAGLERRRILDWTMAFAGLSSVWIRDDGDAADDDLFIVALCAAERARS